MKGIKVLGLSQHNPRGIRLRQRACIVPIPPLDGFLDNKLCFTFLWLRIALMLTLPATEARKCRDRLTPFIRRSAFSCNTKSTCLSFSMCTMQNLVFIGTHSNGAMASAILLKGSFQLAAMQIDLGCHRGSVQSNPLMKNISPRRDVEIHFRRGLPMKEYIFICVSTNSCRFSLPLSMIHHGCEYVSMLDDIASNSRVPIFLRYLPFLLLGIRLEVSQG